LKQRKRAATRSVGKKNACSPKPSVDGNAEAHAVIIGVFPLFVKGSARFSLPNFPKRAYFHAETSLRQSFFNIFSLKPNAPSADAKKFSKNFKKSEKKLAIAFRLR
jgi:hypothetical protein